MKKLSLIVMMSMGLAACTASTYSQQGNATILSSKTLSADTVELVVERDNGEVVTLTRQYDSHATAGARVHLSDSDLDTIRRYEFK